MLMLCVFVCFRVNQKMSEQQNVYTVDQAHEILSRIRSIHKSLSLQEKNKQDLMQVIQDKSFNNINNAECCILLHKHPGGGGGGNDD